LIERGRGGLLLRFSELESGGPSLSKTGNTEDQEIRRISRQALKKRLSPEERSTRQYRRAVWENASRLTGG